MSNVIYEGAKDTAKKIRVELKKNFPGVKFSVRSSTYSMGSSVDVSWTDLPRQEEVDAILDKFQSGYFDGMQDMYISGSYEYEGKLYSGAKHVSGQRNLSAEYRNMLEEKATELFSDEYNKNDYRYYSWLLKAEEIIINEAKEDEETTDIIVSNEIYNSAELTITLNEEKKGIELRFVSKPSEEVRTQLKSNGFRYSKYQNLWYAKQSSDRIYFANELLVKINNNETVEESTNNLHIDEEVNTIEINPVEDDEILNSVTIEETEEVATDIEQPQEPTQIKPISIENVEDQNIRTKGIFAALNKNNTIEEYKEEVQRDCYTNTCKITDIVTLSPEDYEIFTHNLLNDFNFIAGKGGTNSDFETDKEHYWELTKEEVNQYRKQCYNLCVLVKAEGKESILIDPSGYNYSRYVAFMEEDPQQDKETIEPAQGIKEETKVINIIKVNKTIPTNSIDSNTNTDTTDMTELSPEEEHIKNLFKDALNELIQEQTPSFNHEIKYKTNKAKIIDFSSYKQNKA